MVDDDPTLVGPFAFWPEVTAVVAGGAIGTTLRYLLLKLSPTSITITAQRPWYHAVPWWLIVINTIGVFVAVVVLRGPLRDHSPDDVRRLFVITGILGGLTSYSALVRAAFAFPGPQWWAGALLLAASITVAVGAAMVGERLARRRWA